MKRIVILNPKIKDDFEEIIKGMGESVEAGQDRIAIMEKYIIDALNTYNHKLKINYVKYLDCKTIIEYLPEFKLRYNQGKYHRLIIEEDEKNKVVVNNDYKCKYYDLNFENKTLKLKADSIKKAIKWGEKNNTYTIYGSQEKFFWTKALPITQIAFDLGYKIDFSDYEKFVDYYLPYSSSRERKGKRCKVVLDYLKKYCKYD